MMGAPRRAEAPAPRPTCIALSPDGGSAAIAGDEGIDRIEIERGHRRRVHDGRARALAFAGERLWALIDGSLIGLSPEEPALTEACDAAALFVDGVAIGFAATTGLARIDADGERLETPLSHERGEIIGFAGRGLIAMAAPGRLSIVDLGGAVCGEILIGDFAVRDVRPVFSGRFAACWMASSQGDELWVLEPRGRLVHRVEMPALREWTVAGGRGVAVGLDAENKLHLVCLRAGRPRDVVASPVEETSALATDAAGSGLLLANIAGDLAHLGYGEAFATPQVADEAPAKPAAPAAKPAPPVAVVETTAPPIRLGPQDVARLAAPGGRSPLAADERRALVDVEVRWCKALAAAEIARQWERGVLGARHHDRVPFEAEVLALVGAAKPPPVDPESVEAIERELESAAEQRAAVAAAFDGHLTPAAELAARFRLSDSELALLWACVAPALDAEARRLYAIATDSDGWATEALLARMVGPASPGRLIAEGLLHRRSDDAAPTAALEPAAAVIELLRDAPELEPVAIDVEALFVPGPASEAIAQVLGGKAGRLVLRGARGRGRAALARHLVGLAGNHCAVIDDGDELAGALRRARIHGHIPCVRLAGDSASADLAAYPGAVFACIPPTAASPLEAGAPVVELPPLSDRERRALWDHLLPDDSPDDTAALAARFHVPPATALEVVSQAGRSAAAVERALRNSLGEALRALAEPITRLPTWSEVVLDDDLAASVRELIDRRRHFDRVCFEWGMDAAMRSARGLVALFSGPPGTGKTLAAGLIARELERPLYRVDLSRIMSKWIGETEKQLAALFDAAEQADAVVLFDEADSLFSKRTAVKSANDRHANLEVNYILQRLDTFRGVAILTTNQRSAIDPAFRRRLTAQLHFPLPDTATRERLWRVHLPARGPVARELDLADLADRFPFTGGQIRNIAIRAAFLAAGDDQPLSQSHFQRAIELEYAERGKLSPSGRLE